MAPFSGASIILLLPLSRPGVPVEPGVVALDSSSESSSDDMISSMSVLTSGNSVLGANTTPEDWKTFLVPGSTVDRSINASSLSLSSCHDVREGCCCAVCEEWAVVCSKCSMGSEGVALPATSEASLAGEVLDVAAKADVSVLVEAFSDPLWSLPPSTSVFDCGAEDHFPDVEREMGMLEASWVAASSLLFSFDVRLSVASGTNRMVRKGK